MLCVWTLTWFDTLFSHEDFSRHLPSPSPTTSVFISALADFAEEVCAKTIWHDAHDDIQWRLATDEPSTTGVVAGSKSLNVLDANSQQIPRHFWFLIMLMRCSMKTSFKHLIIHFIAVFIRLHNSHVGISDLWEIVAYVVNNTQSESCRMELVGTWLSQGRSR